MCDENDSINSESLILILIGLRNDDDDELLLLFLYIRMIFLFFYQSKWTVCSSSSRERKNCHKHAKSSIIQEDLRQNNWVKILIWLLTKARNPSIRDHHCHYFSYINAWTCLHEQKSREKACRSNKYQSHISCQFELSIECVICAIKFWFCHELTFGWEKIQLWKPEMTTLLCFDARNKP